MDRWTDEIVNDYYQIMAGEYFAWEDEAVDLKTDLDYLREMHRVWVEYELHTVFPSFDAFLPPNTLTTF